MVELFWGLVHNRGQEGVIDYRWIDAAVMQMFLQSIAVTRELSMKAKLWSYYIYLPIPTYGYELWSVTKGMGSQI